MKNLFLLFLILPFLVNAQWQTAAADCNIATRLCDANVSYSYQLLNDGVVDDAYPTLGVPNLFRSQPTKWEAQSCFMKFTAKYSGEFGFTVCPETPEALSYLFLDSPVCEDLETGAFTLTYMDSNQLERPDGCRGMNNPVGGGSGNAWPLQNIVAGKTYMIFVRIKWYTQPGTHRFTITFAGQAKIDHPDLFEHPDCLLATNNQAIASKNVNVYPNPFNEIININSNIALAKTEIYNILGERVFNEPFNNQIDTSFLGVGVYFLRLYDNENGVYIRKIVKR